LSTEDELEQPSSPSVKKSEEKGIVVVHEVKCKLYVKVGVCLKLFDINILHGTTSFWIIFYSWYLLITHLFVFLAFGLVLG